MDPVTAAAPREVAPELKDAIAEARTLAREQVFAAWQLLETNWRESLDQIFDQRFGEVESRLAESVQDIRASARREITESLNATLRRLRQAESDEERLQTLLEAAAPFCGKSAVFRRGDLPLVNSRASAAAVESMDTVVAAGVRSELGDAVADRFGEPLPVRVYLFPIVVRQRTLAVLYAGVHEEHGIDVSALEMLTSITASTMDVPETVPANLVSIAPAVPPTATELSNPEQEVHLRAQRFARTRIAELVLRQMPVVREGRAGRALYLKLREEIDAGRESFRRHFVETCPSMVDYYHLELVRTLAKGDASVLGSDYPGPLC